MTRINLSTRLRFTVYGLLGTAVFCWCSPALAIDLKIQSVSYEQHFAPDESIVFTVVVKNNESTSQFAEVDVTVTNIDTRVETTLTPVLTGTVPASGTLTLPQTSYKLPAGIYTVSFPLFDGNGVRVDRVQGKFPIHVGKEKESLEVFPEVISLGGIPPGRYMHPTPIDVSWSFFRFNRLRVDQPFVVRIYTDNAARYRGIPEAIRRGSPAGLVSMDGRYTLPLKFWTLNHGPETQVTGWDSSLAGPPPVDDDDIWRGAPLLEGKRNFDMAAWIRLKDLSEMIAAPFGWSRGEGLIGQDPHDVRYAVDRNVTGDFTLKSPFTFYLATEAGPTAVEGAYSATLIVELWSP